MAAVRAATVEDVSNVVAVHAAVAAEGRWIGTEAPVDFSRFQRLFEASVAADGSLLLVAVDGVDVVGYLGLYPTVPGVLGLGMALAPHARGQGTGTALLAAAVEWATAREGVHKVELEVWPHNMAARALYERAGFATEGRRRRQYRRRSGELWDSIVMGLVLDGTSPGSPYDDGLPGSGAT
jgi:RimJ/RimL family protein N-acetyltransferase